MLVELRSLDTVKPYPGNLRVNDAAVLPVANSVKTFDDRFQLARRDVLE